MTPLSVYLTQHDTRQYWTVLVLMFPLMIRQRWTSLRLQAKYSRLRLFNLGEMSCIKQHNGSSMNLNTISLVDVRTFTFVFVRSPGKIAVLELWLSPLHWVLNWYLYFRVLVGKFDTISTFWTISHTNEVAQL